MLYKRIIKFPTIIKILICMYCLIYSSGMRSKYSLLDLFSSIKRSHTLYSWYLMLPCYIKLHTILLNSIGPRVMLNKKLKLSGNVYKWVHSCVSIQQCSLEENLAIIALSPFVEWVLYKATTITNCSASIHIHKVDVIFLGYMHYRFQLYMSLNNYAHTEETIEHILSFNCMFENRY